VSGLVRVSRPFGVGIGETRNVGHLALYCMAIRWYGIARPGTVTGVDPDQVLELSVVEAVVSGDGGVCHELEVLREVDGRDGPDAGLG
jgi:hypothetical protein